LKTYVPGESFGELALLYNAPRAATIIAKEESILWCLDRATFGNIVKDAAVYFFLFQRLNYIVRSVRNMKNS